MHSDLRRLGLFLGLSTLLNAVMLALVGHFWRPFTPLKAPAPPRLMLLTLLSAPHPIHLINRPAPKPRSVKPPPPKPHVMATPLPPAPRRTPKIAPVAAHKGGATPRPRPRPAKQVHALNKPAPASDLKEAKKTRDRAVPDENALTDAGHADTPKPGDADAKAAPASAASATGAGPGQGSGAEAGKGAGTGAGLFGTQGDGGGGSVPRHIVYVLDISGSMDMAEQRFHGQRRIERARQELTRQLESLAGGESFSIIAFSDRVSRFQSGLVPAGPDTVRAAESFLGGLEPAGDTDLEGALRAALGMSGINVVVVITDGVPRLPGQFDFTHADFDRLAARVQAADTARAPIYTYGLLGPNPDGTDDTADATALLARLAADSGGKFTEVKLGGEGK